MEFCGGVSWNLLHVCTDIKISKDSNVIRFLISNNNNNKSIGLNLDMAQIQKTALLRTAWILPRVLDTCRKWLVPGTGYQLNTDNNNNNNNNSNNNINNLMMYVVLFSCADQYLFTE